MNDKYESIVDMLAKMSMSNDKQVEWSMSKDKQVEGPHLGSAKGSVLGGRFGDETRPGRNGNDARMNYKLHKIDFSQFCGEIPRALWVSKANKYFQLHQVPEELKVGIAEMYLKGKARVWFHGFQFSHPNADWGFLTTEVCRRFAETTSEEVMETFCRIRQYREMAEYVEKFEELKAQAMQALPNLPESYYISVFTSGLKGKIKSMVKIIKPTSLTQTIEIALLQETTISAISKNTKTHKPYIHPKPPEAVNTENKRPSPSFPYKTLTLC
ncbi:Uncharacterized protein Adt_14119 [Abeliophyllum distichum]|uniref:Retrotransposon gag domain-containing protein n=1 Tax=Abeliophyllum distichum TaxID=126358 RepID=A0ABD1TYQ9_9LAMI